MEMVMILYIVHKTCGGNTDVYRQKLPTKCYFSQPEQFSLSEITAMPVRYSRTTGSKYISKTVK
jgi:hypothetical protein